MTGRHTPARLIPAALLVSVALMACNQQGTVPPAERMDALVLGPVQSAHLDALRPNLNLVQHDGSQKLADYDLVIFDGDAHTPQALKSDSVVEEALRAGKWVLGLDVKEDHKRTGFGARLGFVTRGTSPGWLVRTARDENGHPAVWVVDAPKGQGALTSTPFPVGILGDSAAQLGASANAYASAVMSRLRATPAAVRDTPIPSDLIMKTYFYTEPNPYNFTGTYRDSGKQTSNAQYNFTFNVYLDNSGNPQGNFQWVEVNADVTANPTSGTGNFAAMNILEKAWFLDKQRVSVKPSAADDPLFTSFGSSPATANGVTEVTTGTSFTVGFSDDSGPNASYTYTNQQTRSIQDWKLTNESSGNALSWYYRSNNPLNADDDRSYVCDISGCSSAFTTVGAFVGVPGDPNPIAVSQLQLSTQGVWKTTSVQNKTVAFELAGSQGLADLVCASPGLTCTSKGLRVDVPYSREVEVNLASVVPIPLSLTLDPAAVAAGTPVTGKITLASPAVEETDVKLESSDPLHASVPPKVTVKRGETTATFQVNTDPSGAAAGSVFKPTIRAFYAQYSQAQLTITVP